jgi:hypothetical protein
MRSHHVDVDPALLREIDEAGDSGEVEAILILDDFGRDPADRGGPGEAGSLLDRVAGQLSELPRSIHPMPLLGAVFVRASGRFIRHLLQQTEVVAASANSGDININNL